MFKSIQTKTMFFLVALALCLIIITGYMLVFAMDYVVDDIKKEDIRDKALLGSQLISSQVVSANAAHIDDSVLKCCRDLKLSGNYFLINSTGATIGYPDKEKPYKLDFNKSCSVQNIYKNDAYYIAAIAPVQNPDGWFFCTEQKKSDYMNKINNIKTIIIVGVIVIIFVLWPLGKKISFSIQKPIEMLSRDAERIANGDISREISVLEDNELAEIADSFNLMLNKLKNTMQQVLDKSAEAVSMQEIMTYVDETYNTLPTGIISINNVGEIITFNTTAQELTGIQSCDIIGISTNNPTPTQIKKLVSELRRCLSLGSIQLKTITEISNLAGESFPVEYSINIQFGLKNEVIGAICVFRKIDDIQSFEESASRMKTMETIGALAASIAHEIKNPLTSIRGNAQYLEIMLQENNLKFDELDIIMHETDRLTTMLNKFLSYARPPVPEKEELYISDVMQYVVNLLSRDLNENITIDCDFRSTPSVMVDREMFESLFINLMLNAFQAMPDGGKVSLKTSFDKKRNMVCASVRDNGSGIPPEISDKIFDPFFTTKSSGTGMGLPIALRTVDSHKGMIEVKCIEGEMTEFTVMLQAVSKKLED